jgi:glycosyltransferase involved in cell wall biosynthesis
VIPELDVLVLPSQLEGLPMVILESMAAGVVVLATPVGGVPSLIQDGVNGILITRDSSNIAARIQQLALDQDLVQAIGAEAAGTVVREFTIDKVRSRYQLLYDGVLSK